MFGDYQIHVQETGLRDAQTEQERAAQGLDRCMHSPYTLHIVVGRNGREELLFVECQRAPSDGRAALYEACGFYANRTGQWPDFFSFQCEIRKIQAQGTALPACTEFANRRKMLVLSKKEMESYERLMRRSKIEVEIPKSRRRAATAKAKAAPQSMVA